MQQANSTDQRTSRSNSRRRCIPQSLFKTPPFVAALLLVVAATASPARAAFVVTIQQVGSDVVATGSGTLDLAALTITGHGNAVAVLHSSYPDFITVGEPAEIPIDLYGNLSGPTNFGTGSTLEPTAGTGDTVGVDDTSDLVVPAGYTSQDSLSDTSTYTDSTLASLGITPGTYTWTWGSGDTADTFTLEAGTVPEPTSASLLAMSSLALLRRIRGRRNGPESAQN